MTIKGRRIFNYRPMVFFALAMIVGILVSECVYGEGIAWNIALLSLFLLALILVLVFKKSRRFCYIPLALLIGFVASCTTALVYNAKATDAYSGTFTAQIKSEIVVKDGVARFYVGDFDTDDGEYDYLAKAYIDEDDLCFSPGDIVEIEGTLTYIAHNSKFDTMYALRINNDVRYKITVKSINVISSGKLGFPDNLQLSIKKLLYENNDEKSASIAQALVLGDKFGLDDDLYDDIKASGLAHVLAVSGLHVSTLAGALYFVLKKLKVNPKISFIAVLILTFLYSMLCSFTASSLRAVVMSGVFMFASSFGRKKDDLSALSLAAIIILLFRPTAIMDVGFLLSFASVAGIFMFYKPFERFGNKIVDRISPKRHIGKRFASVCSVSFATNLTTYPLVAHFFGAVPTLFVLSNFIVLPYIMLVYVLLLVLVLLSLITSWGGFVWIVKFLLLPFRAFVGAVGSISFATIPVACTVIGIVTLVFAFVLSSRYVFMTKVRRFQIVLCTLSLGLVASGLYVALSEILA